MLKEAILNKARTIMDQNWKRMGPGRDQNWDTIRLEFDQNQTRFGPKQDSNWIQIGPKRT